VVQRAAQLGNRNLLRSSLARWRLQTEVTTAAVARCRQRSLCRLALSRWRQFAARQAWLLSLLRGREQGFARRQLQAWRAWARRRGVLGRLLGAAQEQRRVLELRKTMQHWKRMARSVWSTMPCALSRCTRHHAADPYTWLHAFLIAHAMSLMSLKRFCLKASAARMIDSDQAAVQLITI